MQRAKSASDLSIEDKYRLYQQAVQDPANEVEFVTDEFKRHFKKRPFILREDFCAAAAIACEWVRTHPKNKAFGIDLSPEPIGYGVKHVMSKLTPAQQKRMHYVLGNVLNPPKKKVDVVLALNFSFFIFKERKLLLKYFKKVRASLPKKGMFVIDLMGGWELYTEVEEKTDFRSFSYFWDCKQFNPITQEALFAIHFKRKGQKKIKDVFTYDWRLWSMPELRDLLIEAGFSKAIPYWEGDDGKGGGNGIFTPSENEENCPSWIAYIVALS